MTEDTSRDRVPHPGSRIPIGAAVLLLVAALAGGWWFWNRPAAPEQTGEVVETVRSGDLVITVSNPTGNLQLGSNTFRIEFRSSATNELVDVGTVQLAASMTMPGMVMPGPTTIRRTEQPGVYEAGGQYAMAGSWQMTIQWDGPEGRGSATFEGNVQ
jgi:hypothetical protein